LNLSLVLEEFAAKVQTRHGFELDGTGRIIQRALPPVEIQHVR
jgi:hypothetical protein